MISALVKPSVSEKIHVGLTHRFSSFGSTNTPEHHVPGPGRHAGRLAWSLPRGFCKEEADNKRLWAKMDRQSWRQRQRNVPKWDTLETPWRRRHWTEGRVDLMTTAGMSPAWVLQVPCLRTAQLRLSISWTHSASSTQIEKYSAHGAPRSPPHPQPRHHSLPWPPRVPCSDHTCSTPGGWTPWPALLPSPSALHSGRLLRLHCSAAGCQPVLDVWGGARRDTGHPVKLELDVNNKYFFFKRSGF